jgi:hypothetical protein
MDAERSSLRNPSELSYQVRSKRPILLPRFDWLLIAVGLLWLLWAPAPAEAQPACAHGLCEIGGSLNSACDTCVDDICAGDAYCCTVEWDDSCIEQVLTVCADPACAAACSHSPCEVGAPIDSTCSSCTALVCFNNSSCCTTDWDAGCVAQAEQLCGIKCEPGEDACYNATPITPGTILGTLAGASNDGCESGQVSCRAADVWYSYTQGLAEDMVLSTCTTQRAFGIDTVLSVHTGCPGKRNNEILSNDDWMLGFTNACTGLPSPNNVDAALPLGGAWALDPGETVVIRVAHHNESVRNPFELRVLPEPEAWLALVAGVGALSALSRRRARS